MRRFAVLLLAVVLLAGCGMGSRSKSQEAASSKPTEQQPAASQDGVYVASFTALGLYHLSDNGEDYSAAVGFYRAVFDIDTHAFKVINRWARVEPGEHTDSVLILDPDGEIAAVSEHAFIWNPPLFFSYTIAHAIELASTKPGIYTIIVLLDGTSYAHYQIFFEPPASSGGLPPKA